MIAYIDDVLIYSPTYNSHVNHVCQVLTKLWEKQLYVKGEKYEFHTTKILFLGYIIDHHEISMDQNKVQAW